MIEKNLNKVKVFASQTFTNSRTSLCSRVLAAYLQPGDTIIIGVSGGPDSMYLLEACLAFSENRPLKIIVAHVNHGLRGKESDADAAFVKKYAREKGLLFELLTLKKIAKGNLEEECRKARYAFFEKLRHKYNGAWILTAHQQSDLVETVLFNLVRGSFLDGLKGMSIATPERYLLRPMLSISKDSILATLRRKKIPFRIDSSNKNTNFSRNLLRNKVIPLLKKINPAFEKVMSANIENIAEIRQILANHSATLLNKKPINLDDFLSEPVPVQKNLLAELYKKTHGNTVKFNRKHLEQILTVLRKKKAGIKKEFGDGHFLQILRDKDGKTRVIGIHKTTTNNRNHVS